jgi:hypothetical protein
MVWFWGLGVMFIAVDRNAKLPADAQNPLFALSMRRKLRSLYKGEYFRYHEDGVEYTYPNRAPREGAKLIEIYDQKSRHGFDQYNALQEDQSKQPEIFGDGEYYAQFKSGQYMDLVGGAEHVGADFTITSIGDGDFPRPMVSVFGDDDFISVEPGSPTRFSFNNSSALSEKSEVSQMFSGVDPAQNGKHVLTIKGNKGKGQNLSGDTSTNFTTISIGRSKDRMFEGKFIECTFHLSDISRYASKQIWEALNV